MKEMKRVLSFFLCLVMVLGFVPANAFTMLAEAADNDPVYVIAGSDFQHPNGSTQSAETVTNILQKIKAADGGNVASATGFLFAGDYNYNTGTDTDITALKNAVMDVYTDMNVGNMVFVQGNHDDPAPSSLSPSGENDTEHYGVYVIHEDEYPFNTGATEEGIKALAKALEEYLYDKVENSYNKPVFVISHLPLHFSHRTVNNGDALYASYLVDVMNAAGAAGLNIIYLYGHDHARGYDNYLGGHAVYLEKGVDQLPVATSRSSCAYEPLNFTYMNAGFTGYFVNGEPTTGMTVDTSLLTMTVFKIEDDQVTISRYNSTGIYNLKNAGEYSGSDKEEWGHKVNTTVVAGNQTIDLTTPSLYTVTDADAKVSFTSIYNEAALGLAVTGIDETKNPISALGDAERYAAYQAYTVNTTGYASGNWAEVAIPVPTEYAMANTKIYHVATDGTLTDMDAEIQMVGGEKKAVFLTDTFVGGTYAVVHMVEAAEARFRYEKVTDVDDLENGQYILVFDYDTSTATDRLVRTNVITGTGDSAADERTGFALERRENFADPDILTDDYTAYEFTLTQSGNGWLIGVDDKYAVLDMNNTTKRGEITLEDEGEVFTITQDTGDDADESDGYAFRIYEPNTRQSWSYHADHQLLYGGEDTDNSQTRFIIYKRIDLIEPEVSLKTEWTEVEGKTIYTYTLADSFSRSGSYAIVGSDDDVALMNNNNSIGTQNVTTSGNTLTSDVELDLWTFSATSNATITNGGRYLRRNNNTLQINTQSTSWTINNQGSGEYRIYNSNRYIYYTGSTFGLQSTTSNQPTVRLYQYDRTEPSAGGFYIAEGAEYYSFRLDTTADTVLDAVREGITVYSATDASGSGKKSVDVADVTFQLSENFNSSLPGYATVEIIYGGQSLGSVVIEITEMPATSVGNWVDMSGVYEYVLDTDGVEHGSNNQYLFVGSDDDVAMNADGSGVVNVTIVDGTTLYIDTRAYDWYVSEEESNRNRYYWITKNGNDYLHHASYRISLTDDNDNGNWTIDETEQSKGKYKFWNVDNQTWYLYYNDDGYMSVSQATSNSVRLFKYVGSAGLDGYAKIEGQDLYRVNVGTSKDAALKAVRDGITGYLSANSSMDNATVINDNALTWTWLDTYDSKTEGYYTVQIGYMGKVLGTVEVEVYEKPVSTYELSGNEGYVDQNASQYAPVRDMTTGEPITITVTYTDGTEETVPVTVQMLNAPGIVSTKELGTFKPLDVNYDGQNLSNEFILHVVADTAGNNYPEYPDGGSVQVGKTADASLLQSTGVVNVELSTSGLSTAKGMDVVVVVDTSSSMTNSDNNITVGNNSYTRLRVLQDSLELMLADFAAIDEETGKPADIDIAIVDFNGYIGGGNTVIPGASLTGDSWGTTDYSMVYTGSGQLDADAFVKNTQIVDPDSEYYLDAAKEGTFSTHSGTDYDDGLYNAYMLLSAKAKENAANGEERDQFVIFLSDGAPFSYNGYNEEESYYWWNQWLLGGYQDEDGTITYYDTAADLEKAMIASGDYTADEIPNEFPWFYNGAGNRNRWGQALRGDQETYYKVVGEDFGEEGYYLTDVLGLNATIYSIGFGLKDDGDVKLATMEKVLKDISSGSMEDGTANGIKYYYNAQTASQLDEAFHQIISNIKVAASNAYFVDQMGQRFDLQMASTVEKMNESGGSTTITLDPKPAITITTYDVYTQAEADATPEGTAGDEVTNAMVGQRKPNSDIILETVTFNDAGTMAYSKVGEETSGNIMDSGKVIRAQNFYYNAGTTPVDITLPNGESYSLAPETFCWNIGTIDNKQYVLDYYVYLTGSMEGTAAAGSYDTNEYATLYYENWLGNDAHQDTTSPSVGWKAANVSYGFYLVNAEGKPVVNQTTGETGNFTNSVKVTSPVVFQEILLNNLQDINTIEAASETILPPGYILYDPNASYTLVILSQDGKGSWTITQGAGLEQSTYVTGFKGTEVSNALRATSDADEANSGYHHDDYDYTHTTVWFAVKWIPSTIPDSVVVDYGLPVDISVLANDQFGTNGKLLSLGLGKPDLGEGIYRLTAATATEGFASVVQGQYGTAEINGSEVRYTPGGVLGSDGNVTVPSGKLEMNGYDKFYYEVENSGTLINGEVTVARPQYYYGEVTVIPATTIYYEDDFLTFTKYNDADDAVTGTWGTDGTTVNGATQDEDRPGQYSLPNVDANNVYGYDSAYSTMSKYSLGSARMVTVDANSYATATFSFYGSGFDVISLTSNTTGTIIVQVFPHGSTKATKTLLVDTYYGYDYGLFNVTYTYTDGKWVKSVGSAVTGADANEDEAVLTENPAEGDSVNGIEYAWVATPDAENALYQVPVMQVEGLDYGHYNVVITATYNEYFDHTTAPGYEFYMDAIRIYNPAGTDIVVGNGDDGETGTTIGDIYEQDNEGWPMYQELRNNIIAAAGVTVTENTETGEITVTFPADNAFVYDNGYKALPGGMFIDGNDENYSISDYVNYGPNNELYLEGGQSIAFMLDLSSYFIWLKGNNENDPYYRQSIIADVQLGIKSADGSTIVAQISNVGSNARATSAVQKTFSSSTDMYYSIRDHIGDPLHGAYAESESDKQNDVIVLTNISDTGVLSITNIKITFTQAPVQNPAKPSAEAADQGVAPASLMYMTEEAAGWTLMALRNTEPEVTEPEVTEPEETEPEVTEPEETEPEATEPKVTEPEETEPEVTEPEETEPEETEPEVTEPETTEPEVTEPEETVPETPATFEPRKLDVTLNRDNVKVGNTVIVTVRTSADVDALTVNGKTVTRCVYSRWTGTKTWIVTVRAEQIGEMDIDVVGYNSKGEHSEVVTETITVTKKTSALDDLLNWIFNR